jgi:hypothetical protein
MVLKKSICGVALQLRRCGAPVSAPHSSVFARLVPPWRESFLRNHRFADFLRDHQFLWIFF